MAIVATQLKKGQCVQYQGDQGIILHLEHRTPGKGNALIAATIRSFQTQKTKSIRFSSSEKVDIVPIDRQKLEYSYHDPAGYYFMNLDTYETVALKETLVEEVKDYLKEGNKVEISFINQQPISVQVPQNVELKVIRSAEGLKGNTANNPTKPATLETGKVIQVPLFVKEGELVKVNTVDGTYGGRV